MNYKALILVINIMAPAAYAATPLNLNWEPSQVLQQYIATPNKTLTMPLTAIKPIKSDVDANQTVHTRVKQTFDGIPVWGGDLVIHVPKSSAKSLALAVMDKKTTVNGKIYQGLEKDLQDKSMLNDTQKQRALNLVKQNYQADNKNKLIFSHEKSEPYIYITNDNLAHYIYKISFYIPDSVTGPHSPIALVDAQTLVIYKSWDNLQTAATQPVESIGGNPVLGKLYYDGKPEHFEKLNLMVDGNQCRFENENIILKNYLLHDARAMSAPCHLINHNLKLDVHGKESLSGADGFNGGYSPASDAFFGVEKSQKLFMNWYGIPVFADESDANKQAKIIVYMHYREDLSKNYANAFFSSATKTFQVGDGDEDFYPQATLEVLAHELAHGFTDQHSALIYDGQSGSLNESFSDMTAKALEFMLTGKNDWVLAPGLYKNGKPLRYMNNPTLDGISISSAEDYYLIKYETPSYIVHTGSGVFNKAFYLLATTTGWDTKKAFDVMVDANRFYWLPSDTFIKAACGVAIAAKQHNYNVKDVVNAFAKVGITDMSDCAKTLGMVS